MVRIKKYFERRKDAKGVRYAEFKLRTLLMFIQEYERNKVTDEVELSEFSQREHEKWRKELRKRYIAFTNKWGSKPRVERPDWIERILKT